MRKLLIFFLCGVLTVTLLSAGCGKKEEKENNQSAQTAQTEQQQPADNTAANNTEQKPAENPPAGQKTADQATNDTTQQTGASGSDKKEGGTEEQKPVTATKTTNAAPQAKTVKEQLKTASSQPKPQAAPEKTRVEKYFYSMTQRFLPEKAEGVSCVYQFNITDGNKDKYVVTIKDGKCTMTKGTASKPDITINTGGDLWVDIATDKVNGTTAYLTKKFTAEGDTDYLSNMKKYFKKFEE